MYIYILLPFFLGILAVFQPVLNRTILDQRGLAFAAWLNSVVLLLVATFTMAVLHFAGDRFPEHLQPRFEGPWAWWYVLPGLMGFALVFSLPLSIKALGAFPTIIALLLGQLLCSFCYDAVINNRPLTLARVGGLVFAILGAYLTFRPAE